MSDNVFGLILAGIIAVTVIALFWISAHYALFWISAHYESKTCPNCDEEDE